MKGPKKATEVKREKDFEVFLGGANKERLDIRDKKKKQVQVKKVKKWKEDIGTLNKDDLEVLRQSIVNGHPLSISQQNLLKKLSNDTPIDQKYDPHFSQMEDDDVSDKIEEEELYQSEEEEQFEKSPIPLVQIRQSIPSSNPRPISAIQTIEQPLPKVFQQPNKNYATKPQLRANSLTKLPENPPQPQVSQFQQQLDKETIDKNSKPTPLDDIFSKIQYLSQEERRKLLTYLSSINSQPTQRDEQPTKPTSPQKQLRQPSPQQQKLQLQQQKIQQKQKQQSPNKNEQRTPPKQPQKTTPVQRTPPKQQVVEKQIERQIVEKPIERQIMEKPIERQILEKPIERQIVEKQIERQTDKPIERQNKFEEIKFEKPFDNKAQYKQSIQFNVDDDYLIKFKVLSTWGSPNMVGLTEIELYSIDQTKIIIQPTHIKIINAQSLKQADVLVNGKSLTRDALNMWLGSMPDHPKQMEIEISHDENVKLGGVKVYNYNKSLIDSIKGVKDLEIIYLGQSKIAEIKKGNGFDLDDYGTEVQLIDNFKFPNLHETQSKFASKIRDAINQSDLLENQERNDQKNIPKPNERIDTSKSIANQQQQLRKREQQWQKAENQEVFEKQMEETLQYFNITNQGRFKPGMKVEQEQKPLETDALDYFFKRQAVKEPPRNLGKWGNNVNNNQDLNPQFVQRDERLRIKEEQLKNAQLIQGILNQPVKQTIKIPLCPTARMIQINIHSTWGDRYYVGLNGIEIFDDQGQLIVIKDYQRQIKANPSDINVLPEYQNDPRTIDKLVDGTYFTQSDFHVWLSPFQKGQNNEIFIDLLERKKIGLIRIWNYNKSRIHSFRGAREISILFDQQIAFKGQIKKAPGNVSLSYNNDEGLFDLIIFQNDERILNNFAMTDWINKLQDNQIQQEIIERPNTGNLDQNQRPTTSAKVSGLQTEIRQARMKQQTEERQQKQLMVTNQGQGVTCKILILKILKPWADQPYVGLSGFELFDILGKKIIINNINAEPKDMNYIGGMADRRVLKNLTNDFNITTNEDQMWMIPFMSGRSHYIKIQFDQPQQISYIKIWNYNKSEDESFRGVQFLQIENETQIINKAVLIKRAPGVDAYDFGQVIHLPQKEYIIQDIQQTNKFIYQDTIVPFNPIGFDLQINLLSTYGDIHYIGLNGIEIYDYKGQLINGSIGANPSSVRVIPAMKVDKRIPENLLDGVNDTQDDSHMWLTPFTNRYFDNQDQLINSIYFGSPTVFALGAISIWNYTKTPQRGAFEISILLDGYVIYKGYLKKAEQTVIMFTKNMQLMERFSGKYFNRLYEKQDVKFKNEEKATKQTYAQLDRPITRVKGPS